MRVTVNAQFSSVTSDSAHCVSYSTGQQSNCNSNIPKVPIRLLFTEIKRALHTTALVDSGSDECIISICDLSDELKSTMTPCNTTIIGVNSNTPTSSIGQITVDVEIAEQVLFTQIKCIVMPTKIPFLLGQSVLSHDTVKSYRLSKNEVKLKMISGDAHLIPVTQSTQTQQVRSYYITPEFSTVDEKVKWIKSELGVTIGTGDNATQTDKMCDVIIKYNDIFGSESNMGCFPKQRFNGTINCSSIADSPLASQPPATYLVNVLQMP